MNSITEAIRSYNKHKALAQEQYDTVFTNETVALFKGRIMEICEKIIRGRDEPSTCCEEYSIPFGLINRKREGEAVFDGYYSGISWSIEHDTIVAEIETSFHGEHDSYFKFMIPVEDDKYAAYLSKLEADASKRERDMETAESIEAQKIEERERQLLKELKDKYEG